MKKLTILILIILTSILFIGVKACKIKHEKLPKHKQLHLRRSYANVHILKSNVRSIFDYLIYYNIKNPDIVLKQSIWETGWYKSKACIEKNNLFGFTHDGFNYKSFKSQRECIIYYKKWQDKHYKGGDYYYFLDTIGYAGDTLYTTHLKSIKINVNKRKLP